MVPVPPAAEPDPSDLDLLRRAGRGDWTAFEGLLARYQGRVFGLALRLVGHRQDAEDVTQQTFLSVLEHVDQFREEAAVATWILRIAANHALKSLRKRRGLPTTSLAAAEDPDDRYAALPHPRFIAPWRELPDQLAERAEVRCLLDQALAELDDKYRVVFVLRDIEELSTAETAALLGLTEANVKVRLLRARLLLRERLTEALGDEAARVFPTHDHG
ncbi:MAG: sigma-70 family RNA polymerase sigma factor [Planctomycetia bacterium]|nr:sigma-70 family RNA polymerase sigma factor [Planctomycetia bacterium]